MVPRLAICCFASVTAAKVCSFCSGRECCSVQRKRMCSFRGEQYLPCHVATEIKDACALLVGLHPQHDCGRELICCGRDALAFLNVSDIHNVDRVPTARDATGAVSLCGTCKLASAQPRKRPGVVPFLISTTPEKPPVSLSHRYTDEMPPSKYLRCSPTNFNTSFITFSLAHQSIQFSVCVKCFVGLDLELSESRGWQNAVLELRIVLV